jgi:uncharacterized protein (TIRG00374 family)
MSYEQTSHGHRGRQYILKLIFGLGLLAVVLLFVDVHHMVAVLGTSNPWYLVGIIVLVHFDRTLMAYKWKQLLLPVDIKIPFFPLFRIYSVAPLWGALLPSSIGADAFRLYSLSRYKVDLKAVAASMIVERTIAFAAVLLLATCSLVLMSRLLKDSWFHLIGVWSALGSAILVNTAVMGVIHPESRRYIARLVTPLRHYPLIGKLYRVYVLCCEYRRHLRTLIVVSAWTFFEQMMPILANVLVVLSLDINVSIAALLAMTPLIVLAGRLPISLDGLGVKEGLYLVLLGWVGVSASEAFLLSTIGRVLPLLACLPWGSITCFGDVRTGASKIRPTLFGQDPGTVWYEHCTGKTA